MTDRPRRQTQSDENTTATAASRGFTLVELLIVLAILAVLAAVVIPSITGVFGRSSTEAYETDSDTMRSVVALFYYDGHACDTDNPGNVWGAADPVFGHHYPAATLPAPQ